MSDWLIAGFESFKSDGTTFRDCNFVNATGALNVASDALIESVRIEATPGSLFPAAGFSPHNRMLNINTNIAVQNGADGLVSAGTVRNLTMVQKGYVDADNDILVGLGTTYLVANLSVLGASYEAPAWAAPSKLGGPVGLDSSGTNILIDGFVVTAPDGGVPLVHDYANILISDDRMTSIVRNCRADSLTTFGHVLVENCSVTTFHHP